MMSTASKKRPLESPEIHQPNKKRKIDSDHTAFVNLVLPKEIMLEVFENLPYNDKLKCSEVCKYWWDCASASLNWTLIGIDNYEANWYSELFFDTDGM